MCLRPDQKVVVLIDEYDAPLWMWYTRRGIFRMRDVMRNFYSPLKACDPYLRFVFITGITKFSQLSIFSELNNIENISMDEAYASLCGISEANCAVRWVRIPVTRRNGDIRRGGCLKDNYDGYHFTWPSSDIYNPFSLLTALSKGKISSYWFDSGTPTYLIEMLDKYHVEPQQIGARKVLT